MRDETRRWKSGLVFFFICAVLISTVYWSALIPITRDIIKINEANYQYGKTIHVGIASTLALCLAVPAALGLVKYHFGSGILLLLFTLFQYGRNIVAAIGLFLLAKMEGQADGVSQSMSESAAGHISDILGTVFLSLLLTISFWILVRRYKFSMIPRSEIDGK